MTRHDRAAPAPAEPLLTRAVVMIDVIVTIVVVNVIDAIDLIDAISAIDFQIVH